MKVLMYGSTVLSATVAQALLDAGIEVVGHVPSDAVFPGEMPVPLGEAEHDIKLSVQFDKKLSMAGHVYNLHTGFLPFYGGCNILSHTLKNNDKFQGLTFHKINDTFDGGEILCRMQYPVLPTDTVADLYHKMRVLIGPFAVMCMKTIGWDGHEQKPVIYKRADLDVETQKQHIEEIKQSL